MLLATLNVENKFRSSYETRGSTGETISVCTISLNFEIHQLIHFHDFPREIVFGAILGKYVLLLENAKRAVI